MNAAGWLLPWVLQSTALAVLGLTLTHLLRITTPALRLRFSQVLLPISLALPWLLPAASGIEDALPRSVADVAVTAQAVAAGPVVEAWLARWLSFPALLALWAAGALARGTWLAMGMYRLRCLRKTATNVADEALDRARVLVPVDAACLCSPLLRQPIAWGVSDPVVAVPEALGVLRLAQREAVYVHELLHVSRRDVVSVWLEEGVRTVLWFHPAVWLLVAQLRLAREQVVDAETIARTSARRAYLEALVWCADVPGRTAATVPFFTRHQLLTRVASLTREVHMSRLRTTLTIIALASGLAAGSTLLASVMPVGTVGQAVSSADAPGPLERAAVQPTLDDPAPRRLVNVAPVWPQGAETPYRFRVHVVIDDSGRVPEARVVATLAGQTTGVAEADADAARRAVIDAVRRWQFEAPSRAPLLLVATVDLGDDPARISGGTPVPADGWMPPPVKVVDVKPVYPQSAQDGQITGVVIVEAIVEATGDTSDVRVLRSIPQLDGAAMDAVRQWKYEPSPVRRAVVVTVNFTLR